MSNCMALKRFIDTWGWLTLHDKSEAKHQEVAEFYAAFRSYKGTIYTTDYVLDETFTLLFKRLSFNAHFYSYSVSAGDVSCR